MTKDRKRWILAGASVAAAAALAWGPAPEEPEPSSPDPMADVECDEFEFEGQTLCVHGGTGEVVDVHAADPAAYAARLSALEDAVAEGPGGTDVSCVGNRDAEAVCVDGETGEVLFEGEMP